MRNGWGGGKRVACSARNGGRAGDLLHGPRKSAVRAAQEHLAEHRHRELTRRELGIGAQFVGGGPQPPLDVAECRGQVFPRLSESCFGCRRDGAYERHGGTVNRAARHGTHAGSARSPGQLTQPPSNPPLPRQPFRLHHRPAPARTPSVGGPAANHNSIASPRSVCARS